MDISSVVQTADIIFKSLSIDLGRMIPPCLQIRFTRLCFFGSTRRNDFGLCFLKNESFAKTMTLPTYTFMKINTNDRRIMARKTEMLEVGRL